MVSGNGHFQRTLFFGGGEQNISLYIHEFKKLPWDLHITIQLCSILLEYQAQLEYRIAVYLLAIIVMVQSVKNLGLFTLLYMPALLNTYYLFAPNAVGFFSTVAFLLLVEHNRASSGLNKMHKVLQNFAVLMCVYRKDDLNYSRKQ